MGKTRYLFKKITNTDGTFHAKMGLIRDRNGILLGEKRGTGRRGGPRWQEQPSIMEKKSQWSRTTVGGLLLIQSLDRLRPTPGTGSIGGHSVAGPCPQGTPVLCVTEGTHKPQPPS